MNRRGRSSKLWAVPAAAVFAWPFFLRVGGAAPSPWWLILVVPLGWWSCVKAYDALGWGDGQ